MPAAEAARVKAQWVWGVAGVSLNHEVRLQVEVVRTLAECEDIIGRGMRNFIEVGHALVEIRERSLYREVGCVTFDEYCQTRWPAIGKSYATRVIQAADVADEILISLPQGNYVKSERQVRPIVPLPLDQRLEVYPRVDFNTATPRQVQDAVNEVRRAHADPLAPPPDGVYRCIVIDPPWPIDKIQRDQRPNQVAIDYPTMTLDEIANLPIPDLADPSGAHVYLWTTHKHLPNALGLFDAWGVRYQCLMTWVKNVGFTPFSWMYSTEHVLFGRVGDLDLLRKGLRLDFAAKVREHSRKPEEFYELVRQATPESRLEMFAREAHDGFDAWGNEPTRFEP